MRRYRERRIVVGVVLLLLAFGIVLFNDENYQTQAPAVPPTAEQSSSDLALNLLDTLNVKGRASKTGYSRDEFGGGWAQLDGCDTRNLILIRDLVDEAVNDKCEVVSGVLNDPYTGRQIAFVRGAKTSSLVQIDHVVALSDAWQKGAASWDYTKRVVLANDPLELLAVEGAANEQKSNGDAATWLPSNKVFRCQYVARQIAVKSKYDLWATTAEVDAMRRVLNSCPGQTLPLERVVMVH